MYPRNIELYHIHGSEVSNYISLPHKITSVELMKYQSDSQEILFERISTTDSKIHRENRTGEDTEEEQGERVCTTIY